MDSTPRGPATPEGLQLAEAKKAVPPDVHQDALAKARAAVEEAKDHRAKRKFRLADQALQKAIKELKGAAAGVTDIGEVVDAYALP